MTRRLQRIETHGHYLPEVIYGAAGDYGPELRIDVEKGRRTWRAGKWESEPTTFRFTPGQVQKPTYASDDPRDRLAEMDKLEIDVMGVSATPMLYCYGAKPQDGINYARVYNDAMAQYCNKAPNRLYWYPTLPMQDIKAAIKEAERAKAMGGRGVNIGTDAVAMMDLDDEKLVPFYEYCEAEDVTIWLHPAPVGTDDPNYDPARNVADHYSLGWLLGYPSREMTAIANLIFSGMLDRFPKLRVCMPHGGGFFPYQIGRLDYAWQKKLTSHIKNKEPVAHYIKNLYFDNIVHERLGRQLLLDVMGVDHVFVGSNYGGWDWVDGFAFAEDMTQDPAERYRLCAGNAIKLFKLEGMGRDI